MKQILQYEVIVYENLTVLYRLKSDEISWYSKRYNKKVTVYHGEESDGATRAITRPGSRTHWVHDKICKRPYWDDGSPITAWQAALVLFDIHQEEAKIKRKWQRHASAYISILSSYTWTVFTFLLGCKRARTNGWF